MILLAVSQLENSFELGIPSGASVSDVVVLYYLIFTARNFLYLAFHSRIDVALTSPMS